MKKNKINNLGKNEIIEAIHNINFDKDKYEAYEIDILICNYYDVHPYLFNDLTEKSHDFCYIVDVYELIDEEMNKIGFKSNEDMTKYHKIKPRKPRTPKTNPNQLSLF